MSRGIFGSIYDIVTTYKEKKKFDEIMNDPEERQKSARFGKKFIRCGIGAMLIAALALVVSGVAFYLSYHTDNLAMGFVFILFITCIAVSVLLMLYSLLFILSRLKYVRWQRKLNDLPIGKKTRIFSFIAISVIVVICVVTVILLLKALM